MPQKSLKKTPFKLNQKTFDHWADLVAQELTKKLGSPRPKREFIARYTGGQGHEDRKHDEISSLTFWGLTLPEQRKLAKMDFVICETPVIRLGDLPPEVQLRVWRSVWDQTSIYEIKTIALIKLSQKKWKSLRLKWASLIFSIADDVDNWAHSDSLSFMLAEILEQDPKKYFSLYKKWNRSKNPWLRRQSLVGLYCYFRFREKPLPAHQTLPLVYNLLEDPHFYVQKGVGWTLREIDRLDSKKQKAFVQKNLHRISGVAWFATSELYPVSLKRALVQERSSHRKDRKT